MPRYQFADPAKAAAHAVKIAPCHIAVWRTSDGTVIYVADAKSISWDEDLEPLDGRYLMRAREPRAC